MHGANTSLSEPGDSDSDTRADNGEYILIVSCFLESRYRNEKVLDKTKPKTKYFTLPWSMRAYRGATELGRASVGASMRIFPVGGSGPMREIVGVIKIVYAATSRRYEYIP